MVNRLSWPLPAQSSRPLTAGCCDDIATSVMRRPQGLAATAGEVKERPEIANVMYIADEIHAAICGFGLKRRHGALFAVGMSVSSVFFVVFYAFLHSI
ncbi:hypothetical protein [Rhizobium sp. RU35A]|uniref:hypothetical protein n=1 Tax=Rhizobium sp. RU35A TaxID=1907414 RepID=UPI00122C7054|nr:hypothetical protein [Rhizobium sp. RU35A]